MAGLDALNITNTGLLNINKKVVNSRTFVSNLITAVGSPTVVEGVASGFSTEDYFVYSPLAFTDSEKIRVNFKGVFFKKDGLQTAFQLISGAGAPLTMTFENSRINFTYRDLIVFSFGNLALEDNMNVQINLVLTHNSYEFTLMYGKQILQKSGNLDLTIPLESFVSLNLGSSFPNRENFWNGNINLKEFSIYNNGALLYAPSEGTSWNFSNILVSDGKFPLTDSTIPTANHIYSFPVTEIKRSGNAVLLTCEIGEDSYLTIREMGLYIQTASGRVLFGSLSNLNVNKTKGLAYNLIFTVDTTINVVNAIGFPEEGGIIVEDPDFMEFKDFTTIQQVNTYVLTNLERIIRMNAGAKGSYKNYSIENAQAGIGHNRPQVIYRLQQKIDSAEDCYNSIDTFVKLTNKFQKITEEQVDPQVIQVEGDIQVPKDGVISGFSTSNYITHPSPFTDSANWNFKCAFTSSEGTEGAVASLNNGSSNSPLEIGVLNNKCYLKVKSLESIYPTNLNSYYTRNNSTDKENTYYGWSRKQETPFYNFHCNSLVPASSPVVIFPQVIPLILEHDGMDSSSFRLSIRTLITDLTSTQYIIGKASANSNEGFELFIENGRIKATFYEEGSGNVIGTISTRFNLKLNRFYDIEVRYDGDRYSLHYKIEPEGSEYAEEEIEYLVSDKLISLESSVTLIIGAQYSVNPQNPYRGSLDFSNFSLEDSEYLWKGCAELDIIYTSTPTPTNADATYDNDSYEVRNALAESYYSGDIINTSSLFAIEDHTKYTISISYSENEETQKGTYEVTRIINDDIVTETTVLSSIIPIVENWSNRMSLPSEVFVGVNSSPQISNPFSATINLVDWAISQEGSNWPFTKEVILNNTELIQYYRLPNLNKNQYATKDICNLGRKIRFLSDRFEGNEDAIDFSYEEGITLCMKVALQDAEPKVLLYKSDLVEDIYFSLTFIDQTLTFTLATQDGYTSISKSLVLQEYDAYTNEPIMITVTFKPQYDNWGYLQMFKNNEAITKPKYLKLNPAADPSMFILSNYLTSSEHIGRYLQDLVVIKGVISENDLKYINNLFDTNY